MSNERVLTSTCKFESFLKVQTGTCLKLTLASEVSGECKPQVDLGVLLSVVTSLRTLAWTEMMWDCRSWVKMERVYSVCGEKIKQEYEKIEKEV